MAVEETIKKIITEQLKVEESQVKPEARFSDDLGTDSLHIVEVAMALEDEFGLEIPVADAESFRTVQDAIQYIKKRT